MESQHILVDGASSYSLSFLVLFLYLHLIRPIPTDHCTPEHGYGLPKAQDPANLKRIWANFYQTKPSADAPFYFPTLNEVKLLGTGFLLLTP